MIGPLRWFALALLIAATARAQSASGTAGQAQANPSMAESRAAAGGAAAPAAVPVRTETGTVNGASYRIDVPQNWNHGLVLYFHGYMQRPQVFDPKYPPSRVLQEILNRGYAVARSGYSAGGWAMPQAASETEALRR
ncbi:MAG TPA: hypothetical protein VKT75_06705, partial [Acidobacteriaceae bacterium]|nr:hypothetical protein [Acidobacteriaceae bacterium]